MKFIYCDMKNNEVFKDIRVTIGEGEIQLVSHKVKHDVRTFYDYVELVMTERYKDIKDKQKRPWIYRTTKGHRPYTCDKDYPLYDVCNIDKVYNGTVFIDLDIKKAIDNEGKRVIDYDPELIQTITDEMKVFVDRMLRDNFEYFYLCTTYSASHKGLHIWLYLDNHSEDNANELYRHISAYIYDIFKKNESRWGINTDKSCPKPSDGLVDASSLSRYQGAYIAYDKDILVNECFRKDRYDEDFYYYDENVSSYKYLLGQYPKLFEILKITKEVDDTIEKTDLKVKSYRASHINGKKIDMDYNAQRAWIMTCCCVCPTLDSAWELFNTVFSWNDASGNPCWGDTHSCRTRSERERALFRTCKDVFNHHTEKGIQPRLSHIKMLNSRYGTNIEYDESAILKRNIREFKENDNSFVVDTFRGRDFDGDTLKGEYLGDCYDEIVEILKSNKVIYLESGTGTGKTDFSKRELLRGYNNIVLEPLQSVVKGKYSNVEVVDDVDFAFSILNNSMTFEPYIENRQYVEGTNGAFVFDTFLTNIKNGWIDLNKKVIFVDESHTLVSDSSFRKKMVEVIECLNSVVEDYDCKVIIMSGTPMNEYNLLKIPYVYKKFEKTNDSRKLNCEYIFVPDEVKKQKGKTISNMDIMSREVADKLNDGNFVMCYLNVSEDDYNKFIDNVRLYLFPHIPLNAFNFRRDNKEEDYEVGILKDNNIKDLNLIVATSYFSVGSEIKELATDRHYDVFFNGADYPMVCTQFANRVRAHDINVHIIVSGDSLNFNNIAYNNTDYDKRLEASRIWCEYVNMVGKVVVGKNIEMGVYKDPMSGLYKVSESSFRLDYLREEQKRWLTQLIIHKEFMKYYGYDISTKLLTEFERDSEVETINKLSKEKKHKHIVGLFDFFIESVDEGREVWDIYSDLVDDCDSTRDFKNACKELKLYDKCGKKDCKTLSRCARYLYTILSKEALIDVLTCAKSDNNPIAYIGNMKLLYEVWGKLLKEERNEFFVTVMTILHNMDEKDFVLTNDRLVKVCGYVVGGILTYGEYEFKGDMKDNREAIFNLGKDMLTVVNAICDKEKCGKKKFHIRMKKLPSNIYIYRSINVGCSDDIDEQTRSFLGVEEEEVVVTNEVYKQSDVIWNNLLSNFGVEDNGALRKKRCIEKDKF